MAKSDFLSCYLRSTAEIFVNIPCINKHPDFHKGFIVKWFVAYLTTEHFLYHLLCPSIYMRNIIYTAANQDKLLKCIVKKRVFSRFIFQAFLLRRNNYTTMSKSIIVVRYLINQTFWIRKNWSPTILRDKTMETNWCTHPVIIKQNHPLFRFKLLVERFWHIIWNKKKLIKFLNQQIYKLSVAI